MAPDFGPEDPSILQRKQSPQEAQNFQQRGRRVADGDDGTFEFAHYMELPHGFDRTRGVQFLGAGNHIGIGNTAAGLTAKVLKTLLIQTRRDHLYVQNQRTAPAQGANAGLDSIGMKGHQLLEFKIRSRMNHPTYDLPFRRRKVMRTHFTVDDGKAIRFNSTTLLGHLPHIAHEVTFRSSSKPRVFPSKSTIVTSIQSFSRANFSQTMRVRVQIMLGIFSSSWAWQISSTCRAVFAPRICS
jgi:hypothetical protein